MMPPTHDLVLSIHLNPLCGDAFADRFHREMVTFAVSGGYSCHFKDRLIIEVIQAYTQLVACDVTSPPMVVDEVDGYYDLIGE